MNNITTNSKIRQIGTALINAFSANPNTLLDISSHQLKIRPFRYIVVY